MPTLWAGDHTATTVDDVEQFAANTASLARAALAAGAAVIAFPAAEGRESLDRRLHDEPGLREAGRSGQIRVASADEVQWAPGRFDPVYLHRAYAGATAQALRGGYSGLWVSVDMGWAAPPRVEPDALVEFEAGAFPLFDSGELTALCQYDVRTFPAETVSAAGRAHPCNRGIRLRHARAAGGRWRLTGETDLSNETAWDALMTAIGAGDHVDITKMTFMSAHALGRLGLVLSERPDVTVTATRAQAGLFALLGVETGITVQPPRPAAP